MLKINDIFHEICMKSEFNKIIKMGLMLKQHLKLIKSYNYYHYNVKIKNFDKICLYNFKDITPARSIIDDNLKLLRNCHTLDLSECNITDGGIEELRNCNILDLSGNNKISNYGIKELNCHILGLYGCDDITNDLIKELRNYLIN